MGSAPNWGSKSCGVLHESSTRTPPAGLRCMHQAGRKDSAHAHRCPPPPRPGPGRLPCKLCGWLLPFSQQSRAMEETGTPEPRARPRERDPGRRPRLDRDRHPERARDRAGDPRRERNGGARRNGGDRREEPDRRRERDRQDRHRDRGPHAGEHRVPGKSRQNRRPGEPRVHTRDETPPPWPTPKETHEAPPPRKEDFLCHGPER